MQTGLLYFRQCVFATLDKVYSVSLYSNARLCSGFLVSIFHLLTRSMRTGALSALAQGPVDGAPQMKSGGNGRGSSPSGLASATILRRLSTEQESWPHSLGCLSAIGRSHSLQLSARFSSWQPDRRWVWAAQLAPWGGMALLAFPSTQSQQKNSFTSQEEQK